MLLRFTLGFFLVASVSDFAMYAASGVVAPENDRFAIVRFCNPEAPYYYHGASYMSLLQHFCINVSQIEDSQEGEQRFCVELETIKPGMHGWFALFLIAPGSSINSVVRDPILAEKIRGLGNISYASVDLNAIRSQSVRTVEKFFENQRKEARQNRGLYAARIGNEFPRQL